jgi:hypothetical protein
LPTSSPPKGSSTPPDWDGPLGIILDAIAECQAQIHDAKLGALDKILAELEAPVLLKAMFDIGYFPPKTPPDATP